MILVGDERETQLERSGSTSTKATDVEIGIRSRLLTTELRVHQVNVGILRDNVFSETPPLETV